MKFTVNAMTTLQSIFWKWHPAIYNMCNPIAEAERKKIHNMIILQKPAVLLPQMNASLDK